MTATTTYGRHFSWPEGRELTPPIERRCEPGAVAGLVDYLRSCGDEVVPLGLGQFRFNMVAIPLDELGAIANTRRTRHDLARLEIGEGDFERAMAAPSTLRESGYRLWTAAADAELARLRALELTNNQIAGLIGRTGSAVQTRVGVLDLPRRIPPSVESTASRRTLSPRLEIVR